MSHTRAARTQYITAVPAEVNSKSQQALLPPLRSHGHGWVVLGGAGRNAGRMQSLQDKASEWSGVAAADAFAIDDVNLFESLGGTPQPFVDLSTNFYTRSARRSATLSLPSSPLL